MSKGKSTDVVVNELPPLPERTKLEMEAGRKASAENAASFARAEAARTLEAAEKASEEVEEKRKQAEDKLRVVAEAEAAHAAKAQPASNA